MLPVIAPLHDLDKNELKKILVEPRNALVKQYKKAFAIEGVNLEFTPDSINEIANEAFKRHIGARGLRSILEGIMLNLMYEVPSREDVSKILITGDVIGKKVNPLLLRETDKEEEKSA
ncbi:ATP-dependent Clp protease ATP-binding subunit ClpX [subsurface metagenome]